MKSTKNRIIVAVLAIFPIVATVIVFTCFQMEDIGSYIGGLLAYIGTVVLGIVAFLQNEKLHRLEETSKRSQVFFSGNFEVQEMDCDPKFIENSQKSSCNYFVFADNENFQAKKLLHLVFPFDAKGYDLEEISLKELIINEDSENSFKLIKNKAVKTELVYSVEKKSYQLEIAVLTSRISDWKRLIKSNDFIISLKYELMSSVKVKSAFSAKLNFFNNENFESGRVDNISYTGWENGK